jgi:hypothetical protein
MRFPNPRLLRIGAVTGGYIAEPGDGELVVPPVLQPVMDLSEPISVCFSNGVAPPSPLQFSAVKSEVFARAGAGAAANTAVVTIGKGLWNIDINYAHGFTGTTNVATNASALELVDPANNAAELHQHFHITGQFFGYSYTLKLLADRDGWALRLSAGATVAGDALFMQVCCVLRKIL